MVLGADAAVTRIVLTRGLRRVAMGMILGFGGMGSAIPQRWARLPRWCPRRTDCLSSSCPPCGASPPHDGSAPRV